MIAFAAGRLSGCTRRVRLLLLAADLATPVRVTARQPAIAEMRIMARMRIIAAAPVAAAGAIAAVAAVTVLAPATARAQLRTDSTFNWYTYARQSMTRVRVYEAPSDTRRPLTVLLDEQPDNAGPTVAEDLSYLAERIARSIGFDPAEAEWYVRFSLQTSGNRPRVALFRVVLRREKSGRLTTPGWRPARRGALRDRIGEAPE